MGTNADGLAPGAEVPEQLPEAVGFGRYLVEVGLVTPLELRAALAYQRSTGIRLGAAASALGFVSALKNRVGVAGLPRPVPARLDRGRPVRRHRGVVSRRR